jgi:hypothetical protein
MSKDLINNNELDKIMLNALNANDDLSVPSGLTDKTIRKLEKRTILRELVIELSIKLGIVLSSLAVLALVFVFFNGVDVISNLITRFITNWQIISSLLLIVFITILIDQVVLKYYNQMNKEVKWEV